MPASVGAVCCGAMGRAFARGGRTGAFFGFAFGFSDLAEKFLDLFFGDVLVAAGV